MGVTIQPEQGGTFEYIQDGALMVCSKGTLPCRLKALPKKTFYNGATACTTIDRSAAMNGFNFGLCLMTQKPCKSCIILTMWTKFKDNMAIEGKNALLDRSEMRCGLSGKITFMTSGQ